MAYIKKHQKLKVGSKHYKCVCVDKEVAILAPRKGSRTSFRNMIAIDSQYSQLPDDIGKTRTTIGGATILLVE